MHIVTRPGPCEWMSKQPIVFRPTGIEMVDHLLSARPISSFKVMRLKTPQQQFSLIQPRSMCRCHKRPDLRVTGEKLPRLTRNVARPSIPDQVNASCFAVLSKQLRQLPAQVLTELYREHRKARRIHLI